MATKHHCCEQLRAQVEYDPDAAPDSLRRYGRWEPTSAADGR